MPATIFYFSGTGNSYIIAKSVAQRLQGLLAPIASLINEDDITADSDIIGLVFPVYYGDVPNMVRSFLTKLKGLDSKYVFAVCNFGGGVGSAMKTVKGLLRSNGGELMASYGIHMPQNAFHKPWENKEKLYANMDEQIERICQKTNGKAKYLSAYRRAVDILLTPFTPLLKSKTRNYMLKTTGAAKDESDMSLIYRLDCVFKLSEACNGCGICSNVCPAYNIIMKDGKPKWTHHCENCLACLNFCPQKAISGIAQNDFYYLHPGYTIKLAQQQNAAQ